MPKWEKDKEPFIACIDDLCGGFELIGWFKTEEEANKEYDSWDSEYPDRIGRNKHIFKMIKTSGHDLDVHGSKEVTQ